MAIMRWEPQRELGALHNNIRKMFEDFDRDFFQNQQIASQRAFLPAVDINEDKDNVYFIMDLPGVQESDVKLTVSDGVLTVRGERKRESEQNERNHYRLERSYGEFVRQYALPENIREEDIQANFENGVLEISVPKMEREKPKEREVQIGRKQQQVAQGTKQDKSREVHVTETGKLSNANAQSASVQHN